jgi:glutathione S-transferase
MYTLYYSPGAASLVVHLTLLELGVPFELVKVDIEQRAHKQPDYLKLNPNGVLPTMLIDGKPHHETCALLLLLGERHPEAGLAPRADDPQRADYVQWLVHLSATLQPAFRLWFYPQDAIDDPARHEAVKAAAQRRIEAVFGRLDAELAQRKPYVLGDRFSIADLHTTMLMRWSRNMPKTALAWPNLRALADRVRARPSWDALYAREGLTEWQR